jgi:hypothetical protein
MTSPSILYFWGRGIPAKHIELQHQLIYAHTDTRKNCSPLPAHTGGHVRAEYRRNAHELMLRHRAHVNYLQSAKFKSAIFITVKPTLATVQHASLILKTHTETPVSAQETQSPRLEANVSVRTWSKKCHLRFFCVCTMPQLIPHANRRPTVANSDC